MERTFFTLEQELLKPVFSLYPWTPMPAREGEAPAEPRARFEQALFAATARNLTIGEADGAVIRIKSSYGTTAVPAHSLEVASYEKRVRKTESDRERRMLWVFCGWLGVLGFAAADRLRFLWCFCSLSTVGKVHVIGLVHSWCPWACSALSSSWSSTFGRPCQESRWAQTIPRRVYLRAVI